MEGFKHECKLCDNIITDGNFKVMEGDTKDNFDPLLPKLTFDDDAQTVMCMACSSKLLAARNFKSTCLYTDNRIISYINFEDAKPLDLKEIYAKEEGSEQQTGMLEDREICRLCLHPTNSEHKFIGEVPVDSIQIYIPEINFAKTANPVICMKSHDELSAHSSFIKNCLDVEKERNMVAVDEGDILLHNPFIKTEEIEIKPEPIDDATLSEIICDIKKEEEEEGDTSLHSQNVLVDTAETKSRCYPVDPNPTSADPTSSTYEIKESVCKGNKTKDGEQDTFKAHQKQQKEHSKAQTFECGECDFKAMRKQGLRRHQLSHKRSKKMYKCDGCEFEAKAKVYLERHLLVHKNASEVQMYKCDECEYETKHKRYLKDHQTIHRDREMQRYECNKCKYHTNRKHDLRKHKLGHKHASEVPLHKCDSCDYKSIKKGNLLRHQIIHKDPSEVLLYKCDECDFETKYRKYVQQHQQQHRDPSEVLMYMCDTCDYKSIDKGNLRRHQIIHKGPSEVQLYKCDVCGFETKYKIYLKKHQSKHKNPS